ncbi:MAG: DUF2442 domain-containing protein [Candidatus Babeliales bacterium]|jgi:hypothetical protein
MLKKSKKAGKAISAIEIQAVTKWGIWLLVKEQEFFLPFTKYPWFKKATIEQICDVQCFHGTNLHWSKLDIDLNIDILKSPDQFPLESKHHSQS